MPESQIKTPASLKGWVASAGTRYPLFQNTSDRVAYSCPSWQSKVPMAFVFPKESFHLLCSVFPSEMRQQLLLLQLFLLEELPPIKHTMTKRTQMFSSTKNFFKILQQKFGNKGKI